MVGLNPLLSQVQGAHRYTFTSPIEPTEPTPPTISSNNSNLTNIGAISPPSDPSSYEHANINEQFVILGIQNIGVGSPGKNVKDFIMNKISSFDPNNVDRNDWKDWGKEFVEAFCKDNDIDPTFLTEEFIADVIKELQTEIDASWQDSLFGPDTLKALVDTINGDKLDLITELKSSLTTEKEKNDFLAKWNEILKYYEELSDFNYRSIDNLKIDTFQNNGISSGNAINLANKARSVASRMNSRGRCKKGVRLAFEAAELGTITGESAYMAASQLAKRRDFKEVAVSQEQLRMLPPGAVIVWDKGGGAGVSAAGKKHGHIEVSLGNGQAASDYVGRIMTSRGPGVGYRVFMPLDDPPQN
jgi:hypothetical protein